MSFLNIQINLFYVKRELDNKSGLDEVSKNNNGSSEQLKKSREQLLKLLKMVADLILNEIVQVVLF
jgi:hypothetical protein